MIITLTGNNLYLIRERLSELINEFVKKNTDLALERVDGEEIEVQALIDTISSLPFLTNRKMVVVRNLSLNKSAAEKLEQIIAAAESSTGLVFYEPLTDKRTSFYKTLQKKTQFEQFNELSPAELTKWLVNEAKKASGELNVADANYLVERVGPNQELLANELAKLLIYEPKITKATIDLLTEQTPQSKVFDLLDAAFAGNKARALELYEEQRAQKIEPQMILAMIAWQLRLLVLAKVGHEKPAAQIAKDIGMSPFPVSKAARLVGKLNNSELKRMVAEAFDIDLRSKTRGLDLDEALKTYIVTL